MKHIDFPEIFVNFLHEINKGTRNNVIRKATL